MNMKRQKWGENEGGVSPFKKFYMLKKTKTHKSEKKMRLLLFVVFASTVFAGRCSDIARDALLACFEHHIDLNHDGNITLNEIPLYVKPWFFEMCDINHDGVLNLIDWHHENACCQDRECIYKVCNTCFNKYTTL